MFVSSFGRLRPFPTVVVNIASASDGFDSHPSRIRELDRKLVLALTSAYGPEIGREAAAEALVYLSGHRERILAMDNPGGYLYRVGQSKARRFFRRRPAVPEASEQTPPWFEPNLVPALRAISPRQRVAVVLVHGYEWTQQEVADLLGISRSAVQRHLERGLVKLRAALGVNS